MGEGEGKREGRGGCDFLEVGVQVLERQRCPGGPVAIQRAPLLTTLPDLAGSRRLYPMYFSNRMPHVHCGACLHPCAPARTPLPPF
jgi:hypothetical protein